MVTLFIVFQRTFVDLFEAVSKLLYNRNNQPNLFGEVMYNSENPTNTVVNTRLAHAGGDKKSQKFLKKFQ